MFESNFIYFVLSIVTGSLAGSLVATKINIGHAKKLLSLHFINDINSNVELIEEVYDILRLNKFREIKDKKGSLDKKYIQSEYDKVVKIGDKLDLISYLYLRSELNTNLLETAHLCRYIDSFIYHLTHYNEKERDLLNKFCPSGYNKEKGEYFELQWYAVWSSLKEFHDRSGLVRPVEYYLAKIFG